MEEKMFLRPEYVRALELLDYWERTTNHGHIGQSKETAFVVRIEHYEDCTRYFQDIFVKPAKNGIFLLYRVSEKYNNLRVVPEVVKDLIEKTRAEGEFVIIEWSDNVDKTDVEKFEARTRDFCYWAVKKILFEGLTDKSFEKQLENFAFVAEILDNCVQDLYSSF